MAMGVLAGWAVLLAAQAGAAQEPVTGIDPLAVNDLLHEFVDAGRSPGVTAAIAWPSGALEAWAVGHHDQAGEQPLALHDRLMYGSIGKTWFAALAVQLAEEERLGLDDRLQEYLGHHDWYARLPNAETITLASLLRHTSGVMDHVRLPEFWEMAREAPDQPRRPEELMRLLLDREPLFAVDEGWAYADANYILLGMALEEVLDDTVYRAVWRRFLQPLELADVQASLGPDLPGLAQGWHRLGEDWEEARPVLRQGRFYLNPQFEWCGGGYHGTTADLARWGAELFGGDAISATARRTMLDAAVAAPLAPDGRYGYGVIRSSTPHGEAWGHSGWFPGYLSEMMWFPELGLCIAVQFNTDEMQVSGSPRALVLQIAALAAARADRD